MNPERAAMLAGGGPPQQQQQQRPAMANKPKPTGTWNQTPGEKMIKPMSRSEKKKAGQKVKRKWTAEKPTSKRSQRAGPRSLKKQGLRVRVPKTPEQKAKQLERKEFRMKQQAGSAARKIIKTARREGYRVVKRTARPMKEYMARYRLALIAVEQEMHKKIHNEVDEFERRNAMAFCKKLGFTIENTPGTADIKPRVLGLKGKELDIDNLEQELHAAEEKIRKQKEDIAKYGDHHSKRVDLSKVRDESKAELIVSSGAPDTSDLNGDFVSFGMEDDNEPVAEDDVDYNHKMRRKLNRAILFALVKKENLVRARAMEHCKENGIEMPIGFTSAHKPAKLDNHRMLVDGSIESGKQERVRKRVETAQFNELARVFRKTAKEAQRIAAQKAEEEVMEKYKADRLAKGLPIDDLETNKPWAEHHSEKSKRVLREKRKQAASTGKGGKKAGSGSDSSDGDSSEDGDSDDEPAKPKANESKKRARSESDDSPVETKKMKLSDESSAPATTDSSSSSDQPTEAPKPSVLKTEKKKLKKTVKIADPPAEVIVEEAPAVIAEENSTTKKEKKDKKSKKEKKTEEPESSIANDWNADALDGDAARKDKFLRLLGGKKEGAASAVKKEKKDKSDISKVEGDLEKQFRMGIELKHGGGGGGKRRGIGA